MGIRALLLTAGLVATAPGCKPCTRGYEQQDDGSCLFVHIEEAERDTGGGEFTPPELEPIAIEGFVRPGTLPLDDATSVQAEIWSGANMQLFGPDREGGQAVSTHQIGLAPLQDGAAVRFDAQVVSQGPRPTQTYVFAVVFYGDTEVVVEAAGSPYAVGEEGLSEPMEVVLDGDAVVGR